MKVTVIIIAFTRKTFIKRAISSVINAGPNSSELEIIVIKNFKDSETDEYIDKNGGTNIFTEKEGLSDKVMTGIENATGDYICFLEDDDEFSPNKIITIRDFISEYPASDYIHNGHVMIRDGNIRDGHLYPGIKQVLQVGKRKQKQVMELMYTSSFFNLSSVTISKRFGAYLRENLQSGLTHIVDVAIFLEAYEKESFNLLFIPEELTFYRTHNSSHFFTSNYISFSEIERNLAEREIHELERYTGSKKFAYSDEGLKCFINGWRLRYSMYSPSSSRNDSRIYFLREFLGYFLINKGLIMALNALLSFINFVSRFLAGLFFFYYRYIRARIT